MPERDAFVRTSVVVLCGSSTDHSLASVTRWARSQIATYGGGWVDEQNCSGIRATTRHSKAQPSLEVECISPRSFGLDFPSMFHIPTYPQSDVLYPSLLTR